MSRLENTKLIKTCPSDIDMASQPTPSPQTANLDRYVVIHVATTCDEHGVYVTKDSAEVIELGWILLDAKSCEEVSPPTPMPSSIANPTPAAS